MHEQNTRDKIIEAATRLFSQYSYEEVSTNQLIKEVGNSKGSFYWHFAKKEDLFKEVFEHCYRKTLEYSRIGIDENDSAIDCIKRRLKNMLFLNKIDPYCIPIVLKHIEVIAVQKKLMDCMEFRDDTLKYVKRGLLDKEMTDLPEELLVEAIDKMDWVVMDYLNRHPEYFENETFIDKMINNLYKSFQM